MPSGAFGLPSTDHRVTHEELAAVLDLLEQVGRVLEELNGELNLASTTTDAKASEMLFREVRPVPKPGRPLPA